MNATRLEPNKEAPDKVKLLDQVRQIIRLNHYSIRTEEGRGLHTKSGLECPAIPIRPGARPALRLAALERAAHPTL